MRILVYGSENFENYGTFMRGVVVAIQDNLLANDKLIEVYTAGPHKINNFTAEFINRSEDMFRQNKVKTRFSRVRKSEVIENFDAYDFDHVLSFNTKTDNRFFDVLLDKAESKNVKASCYKY